MEVIRPRYEEPENVCLSSLRAPEILFRLPYTAAIDMWSLGILATTLFRGSYLYPGHSEYDMVSVTCKYVFIKIGAGPCVLKNLRLWPNVRYYSPTFCLMKTPLVEMASFLHF